MVRSTKSLIHFGNNFYQNIICHLLYLGCYNWESACLWLVWRSSVCTNIPAYSKFTREQLFISVCCVYLLNAACTARKDTICKMHACIFQECLQTIKCSSRPATDARPADRVHFHMSTVDRALPGMWPLDRDSSDVTLACEEHVVLSA